MCLSSCFDTLVFIACAAAHGDHGNAAGCRCLWIYGGGNQDEDMARLRQDVGQVGRVFG